MEKSHIGSVFIKFFIKIIKGMLLGLAMLVPGVSISTFAVIFNEYDLMLETLSLNFKYIKTHIFDIMFLVLGLILGFFLTVELLNYLLASYEVYTVCFFIGMMGGSLPWLWINDVKVKKENKHFKASSIVAGIIALAVMVLMRFVTIHDGSQFTSLTFLNGLILFSSGFAGSIAMLLPGVSGSSVLMIFGTYTTMLSAIKYLDIAVIIIFGLGLVAGLVLSSKLFKWLLVKFKEQMSVIIFALVVGSVIAVIPNDFSNVNIFLCLLFFIIAALIIWAIPIISEKFDKMQNLNTATVTESEQNSDLCNDINNGKDCNLKKD